MLESMHHKHVACYHSWHVVMLLGRKDGCLSPWTSYGRIHEGCDDANREDTIGWQAEYADRGHENDRKKSRTNACVERVS